MWGDLLYNNFKEIKGECKYLYKTNYMCTFIKMEYLVANALVELYEKQNIDRISLDEIRAYGIKVEEELVNNQVHAILLYSSDYTKEFLEECSEWFEKDNNYIKIRSGKTIEEIREHFLSYISIDILLALLNKNALSIFNIH